MKIIPLEKSLNIIYIVNIFKKRKKQKEEQEEDKEDVDEIIKKINFDNSIEIKINQKKILFIVNYSLNNKSSPVSAFIIHKYRKGINKNYIEKVYENFSDELKSSYYGKKLISNF